MTTKEKIAFAQGVEEGYTRAAELSSEPDKILRQFKRVSSTFRRTKRTRRVSAKEGRQRR